MNLFNKKTNELSPYVVSERKLKDEDDWLILDWNESTFRIDEALKESLIEFVKNGQLNLYGDVDCRLLKNTLHKTLGVDESWVLFFNGSDSALNICFEAILEIGDQVLALEPEYSQVDTFIKMKGGIKSSLLLSTIKKPTVDELNLYLKGKRIFYFSNPNNPVGFCFTKVEIELLLKQNPSVMFFVDEAYYEFSDTSVVDLVSQYSNLIIFRTFSKAFGLAGIRLGYIITNVINNSLISKVRNGKEVSSIAQLSAIRVLENYNVVKERIREVVNTREWFFKELLEIPGYKVFPSLGNFLLIRHESCTKIISVLREHRILVRDRSSMHLLNNCFRITIGTRLEMERVLNVLKIQEM